MSEKNAVFGREKVIQNGSLYRFGPYKDIVSSDFADPNRAGFADAAGRYDLRPTTCPASLSYVMAMAELISLNRVRKKLARAEREKTAVENRVRFGRTKGEATRDKEQMLRADEKLKGHRLVSEEVE